MTPQKQNILNERQQRVFEVWQQYKSNCKYETQVYLQDNGFTCVTFHDTTRENGEIIDIISVTVFNFYTFINDQRFNDLIQTFAGVLNNKDIEKKFYD